MFYISFMPLVSIISVLQITKHHAVVAVFHNHTYRCVVHVTQDYFCCKYTNIDNCFYKLSFSKYLSVVANLFYKFRLFDKKIQLLSKPTHNLVTGFYLLYLQKSSMIVFYASAYTYQKPDIMLEMPTMTLTLVICLRKLLVYNNKPWIKPSVI